MITEGDLNRLWANLDRKVSLHLAVPAVDVVPVSRLQWPAEGYEIRISRGAIAKSFGPIKDRTEAQAYAKRAKDMLVQEALRRSATANP